LDDLIKTHGDMSEYFRLPKLGQHYTHRWAKEDQDSERVKGNSDPEGVDGTGAPDNESEKMLRKPGEAVGSQDSPFGELTQRLVAGLMEENIMTPIEETLELGGKKGLLNSGFQRSLCYK
jgi:transcriptional adapter 3